MLFKYLLAILFSNFQQQKTKKEHSIFISLFLFQLQIILVKLAALHWGGIWLH